MLVADELDPMLEVEDAAVELKLVVLIVEDIAGELELVIIELELVLEVVEGI